MDEDIQQPASKISVVVGVLGTLVAIVLDILSLIPFVGDIEEIPGGIVFIVSLVCNAGPTILIAQGTAMALKAIPIVQEFPVWTAAWLTAWFLESHPSMLTAKVEQIAVVAGELEGAGAGTEGAAAEGAEGAGAAGGKGASSAMEGEPGVMAGTEGEMAIEGGVAGEPGAAVGTNIGEGKYGEEGGGHSPEFDAERQKREEEAEKSMRLGTEVPPEEEAAEAAFNPKEIRFSEAKSAMEKKQPHGEDENEDDYLEPAA